MKLTNAIKNEIISQVKKNKIDSLEKNLKSNLQLKTLEYIQEKLKPHFKFIESAPVGFLYLASYFVVRFGNGYDDRVYVSFDNDIIIPYSWKDGGNIIIKIEDEKWKKIFANFKKEEIYIKKYNNDLMSELRGFLKSVSTINKLFEVFPEIKEYVNLSNFTFYPPVVQTDKLKKLLNEGV